MAAFHSSFSRDPQRLQRLVPGMLALHPPLGLRPRALQLRGQEPAGFPSPVLSCPRSRAQRRISCAEVAELGGQANILIPGNLQGWQF